MHQYELLWQYQQVDMELDQYEKEMRASSNRKELLKHREFLLEQQSVLKKIETDVEIMSDRMEALADEITAWDAKNPAGAYTSESFGDYSYTRAGDGAGGAATWQSAFASRMRDYQLLTSEVMV